MAAIWLSSRGHDVVCLCPGDGLAQGFRTPLGTINADFVAPRLNLAGHLRFLLKVLSHRARSGPEVIFYVHGSAACPACYLGLLLASRRRVVYHTQDFLEPGRHPHWEFFERRMARRAAHVICNEPNRARFMASNYRLGVVPTVVRTALPREWPLPEFDGELRGRLLKPFAGRGTGGLRIILNIGPYSPVRCSSQLIEALSLLPERYVLVFTGGAGETVTGASAIAKARVTGMEDRIALLGELPYEELLRLTACCDIGVLLYPNDGIGNYYQAPGRLAEYVGCGLPVVTSSFPGLELLVMKHRLGAVCDPDNPPSIAAAIEQVCDRMEAKQVEERSRLALLARTELAYENDAEKLETILGGLSTV
jgi:glycosyltransferase involved in cell wall biosynthesis